jgi:hypothetical protein
MLGALGSGQIEMGQYRQVARIMANHSHGKRGGDKSCATMTGIESLEWGN